MSIQGVAHIGLTVTDVEKSIGFYRDVLGLELVGRISMEGPNADELFGAKGCRAKIAYMSTGQGQPPLELIEFEGRGPDLGRAPGLFAPSISEVCLYSDDIWSEYRRLVELGVEFLSEPKEFDFTSQGFSKTTAVYLRDPDGVIIELYG
ncbi:MAG: VOC family protein [Collinsella sp.]|nr:VOC family protein [Collinsella sp.]